MQINKTLLTGILHIIPKKLGDNRGYFVETYSRKIYENFGIDLEFVQDNQSFSSNAGTVRGLHFQIPPHTQAKLISCNRGAIFDVAVDIRKGSPTYGKWIGYTLSKENGAQLYIPSGFAHGFITLQSNCEIFYKCTEYYAPESERALRWDDPDINIDWPLKGPVTLSKKDANAQFMADFVSPFLWEVEI